MENKHQKKCLLSEQQLLYMKLFTHGYNDEEAFEFLNVSTEMGEEIKYSIRILMKKKYGLTNWNDIIKKCFELNVLCKFEFVDDLVKEQANIYVNSIYEKLTLNVNKKSLHFGSLEREIFSFLKSSQIKLKKKYMPKENRKEYYKFSA